MIKRNIPFEVVKPTSKEVIVCLILAVTLASVFLPINRRVSIITVRPFDVGIVLTALAVLVAKIRIRLDTKDLVLWAYLLFVGYVTFFGVMMGVNRQAAVREFIQFSEFLVSYILILAVCSSQRRAYWLFRYYVIAIALIAIWCAVYHIAVGRYAGWKLLDEAKLSFGILATVLLLRELYTIKIPGKRQFWSRFAAGLSIVLLILSGERKAWVGFAAAVAITVMVYVPANVPDGVAYRLRIVFRSALMMLAMVIILAGLNSLPYVNKQLASFVDLYSNVSAGRIESQASSTRSNEHRWEMMLYGWEGFKESPLVGQGYGYAAEARMHSKGMAILTDYGALGMLAYMLFYAVGFRRCLQISRSSNSVVTPATVAMAGVFAYSFLASQFLSDGPEHTLFFVFPMAFILAYLRKKSIRIDGRTDLRPTQQVAIWQSQREQVNM